MIQRIQTVYLLVIAILMIVTLFSPLATLVIGGQVCTFDATGLSTTLTEKPELLFPTWGLFVLSAVIALIAMVTIFLYRKRILQIRLSVFNGLLMLGFYGLFIEPQHQQSVGVLWLVHLLYEHDRRWGRADELFTQDCAWASARLLDIGLFGYPQYWRRRNIGPLARPVALIPILYVFQGHHWPREDKATSD